MTRACISPKGLALSLSMIFLQSAQAQAPVTVDNLNNARKVESYLATYCNSYKADDVQNCVETQLELTQGIANAFEDYVSENYPSLNISRRLDRECQNNFNAIVAQTPPSAIERNPYETLPVFVRNGFLGSRQCLLTIESIGKDIGVDYMPSARALLHDMINKAEKGELAFRYAA